MKIINPGHYYELMSFDPPMRVADIQRLQFIEKAEVLENIPGSKGAQKVVFKTIHNGTTNEEVLEVLIDRMKYLQDKSPCRENAIVITKLEECLMWLNHRTKLREQQNVEGTALAHKE